MLFGKIVVIKRNGTDGAHFPLTATSCLFGRSNECDIRIQLPTVSKEHCRMDVNSDAQVFVTNLSQTNPTQVNGKAILAVVQVKHCDVFTISDRSFRFEFAPDSKHHPRNNTPQREKKIPNKILSPKSKPPTPSSAKQPPLTPRSDNKPVKSPKAKTPVKVSPLSDVKKKKSPSTASPTASAKTSLLKENAPVSTPKRSASPKLSGAAALASGARKTIPTSRASMPLGSPYHPPSKAKLRNSISELRRRSQPVTETAGEAKTPTPAKQKSPSRKTGGTPSSGSGKKRKATSYDLPSSKRKRVSFGPSLTPEQFDKTLPPATPVRKGSAPRRTSEPVITEESASQSPAKRRSVTAKVNSTILEESPQAVTKQAKSSPKIPRSRSSSPKGSRTPAKVKSPARTPKASPVHTSKSPQRTPRAGSLLTSRSAKRSESKSPARSIPMPQATSKLASPKMTMAKSTSGTPKSTTPPKTPKLKSPATTPKRMTSPAKTPVSPATTPKSTNMSASKSTVQTLTAPLKSPGRTSKSTSKSPSVISRTARSPVATKSPKTASSPVRTPRSSKSPVRTPRSSKSPVPKTARTLKTAESPARTPKTAESPARTLKTAESPARTPKTAESPARTLKTAESPARSPMMTKSPARSPVMAKLPARSPVMGKSPARSPVMGKSPARSPKMAKSLARSPMMAKSPAKSPMVTKLPADNSTVSSLQTSAIITKVPAISPKVAKSPVRTPKMIKSPARSLKIAKSPVGTLKMARSPKVAKSPIGTPKMTKSPARSSKVAKSPIGTPKMTKSLARSPKVAKSPIRTPKMAGSPKVAKLPIGTLKMARSPIGTPKMTKSPVRTPKVARSPIGTPKMAESPKVAKSPIGTQNVAKSPVGTLKMAISPARSPKMVKSPARSPKVTKSPIGTPKMAKSLPRSPKVTKSPIGSPKMAKSLPRSLTIKSPARSPKMTKSPLTPKAVKSPARTPKMTEIPITFTLLTPTNASESSARDKAISSSLIKSAKTISSPITFRIKSPARTPKPIKSPKSMVRAAKSPARTKVGKSPKSTAKTTKSPAKAPMVERSLKAAKTPLSTAKAEKSPVATPKVGKTSSTQSAKKRKIATPKSLKHFVAKVGTPQMPSAKKMKMSDSVEKVVSPPADVNKMVALRAIHTPRLHSITKKTPARHGSSRKMPRKTPSKLSKKLWSDIVKSGVAVEGIARKTRTVRPAKIVKKVTKQTVVKTMKTPRTIAGARTVKTPRAVARARAPTTGHVHSPATLLVGRMLTARVKTPKPLPKKGRKTNIKVARLSQGKACYDGLAEMFKTPSPKKMETPKWRGSTKKQRASPSVSTHRPSMDATPHSLYADIPDTPNGPGEMFVSPLSSNRKMKEPNKTPSFIGVKNLYQGAKTGNKTPSFIGVKNLYKKVGTNSDINVTGMKRIFATPKTKSAAKDVSYEGVKRLMASPRVKKAPGTPSGLEDIFKTPTAVSLKKEQQKTKTPRKRQTEQSTELSVTKKSKIGVTCAISEATVLMSPVIRSVKKTRGRKAQSPKAEQATPRGRKASTRVKDVHESPVKLTEAAVSRGRRGKTAHTELKGKKTVVKMTTPKIQRTRKGKPLSRDRTSPMKVKTPEKKASTRKGKTVKAVSDIPVDGGSACEEMEKVMKRRVRRGEATLGAPSPVTKLPSKHPAPMAQVSVAKPASPEKKAATPRGRARRGQAHTSPLKKLTTPKRSRGRDRVTPINVSPAGKSIFSPEKKVATPKRHTRRGKIADVKVAEEEMSPKPVGKRSKVSVKKSSGVKARKTPVKNLSKNKSTIKESAVVQDAPIVERSPKVKAATPKECITRGKVGRKTPEKAEKIPVIKTATPKSRRGKTTVAKVEKTDIGVQAKCSQKREQGSDKASPVKTRTKRVVAVKSPAAKTPVKNVKRPADTPLEEVTPKKSKTRGHTKLKTPLKSNSRKSPKRKALLSITPIKIVADAKQSGKDVGKPTRGNRSAKSQSPVKKQVSPVKKTSVKQVSKTNKSKKVATPAKRVTRSRR
ncbi:mucin-2-like [Gigantopelta aegis]|uniref:mucin-2-like n=1 Tax=Gigantopelta aegis TaxID=1735272 RepID=UPI001B8899A9|nr:mucin-2-like [Gigantopelta aegis]